MLICPLYSSSSGNSTFIATKSSRILVDAGVSAKRICSSLESIGSNINEIDGIVITHEHIDHIRGIGVLARRYKTPIYANTKTWQSIINDDRVGEIPHECIVSFGENDFFINNIGIEPIKISHDAVDPVGFNLWSDNKRISTITDLGKMSADVLDRIMGAQIVLLESNHDIHMLKNGEYPVSVKRRILSNKGHISNDVAADTMVKLILGGTKKIALAHLSEHSNTPEAAFFTIQARLAMEEMQPGRDIELAFAWPKKPGEMWAL